MTREAILSLVGPRLAPYGLTGDKLVPQYCPLCRGGDRGDQGTFLLNLSTGGWVCKRGSCGRHGSLAQLCALLGIPYESERRESFTLPGSPAQQFALPTPKILPRTQKIEGYFAGRGISPKTLSAYGVGADGSGNIFFPFTLKGQLVYGKYRSPQPASGPKEWQTPGAMPILFGMDNCRPDAPLVITEGLIDALSLAEAGIPNAVSVPSGCNNLNWVEHCWTWLEQFTDIVLFGDNDPPGQQMVEELIRRLGEYRCRKVCEYPLTPQGKPCKDANEILTCLDAVTLGEMVASAQAVPTKGLLDLSTVSPIDPTGIPRIKTNIPMLDECLGGLAQGAVTVFTGKAGSGKSTIGGQLLLAAIQQGYKVCAYSGELSKEEFQSWIHFQAAGSDYITLKYDPVKGKRVPFVQQDVAQRIAQWYAGKFFIFDTSEVFESNQSQSILDVFSVAANRYGCKLFLVDNLMTALSDCDEETRAQGRFVAALKRFALRYRAHVIIIAHARKTRAGERLGQDDVSGNSATVKLAHGAVVVEQPNLRIIKARDSGLMRLVQCCYCPDSRRIYQADCGDKNRFGWDASGIPPVNPRADSLMEYQCVCASDLDPF